jgi:hypothetical protein
MNVNDTNFSRKLIFKQQHAKKTKHLFKGKYF